MRVVTGNLVGDDHAFAEPGWGAGWAWDDLKYGYGAAVTALQFNENEVTVIVGPGMAPGTPAIIATSPAGSGLFTVNLVATTDGGGESRIDIERQPGTPFLERARANRRRRGARHASRPPWTARRAST